LRVAELGEFGLLGVLEERGLIAASGREGAWDGERAVTQDILVEGVHFRREWTSWRDLGYKAAAVNLSDLAAMCAAPEGLLVTLCLPHGCEVSSVVELYEGLNEPGFPVLGGDTTSGPVFSIAVTAVGRSEHVPGRGGALPGDALVVTGPLGGAAAGLYALEQGRRGFDDLVRAFNRPPYRLDTVPRLCGAHALIDLSDGIASDAKRIAERSRCKLVIETESIPLFPRLDEVADLPFWTRGEDYELLAALAPEDPEAAAFFVVGRCERGQGVELLRGGEPLELAGWDHFSA
jgi:thiamine-monophosphate kinase